MRITTWNVNSIRKRHDVILRWLKQNNPDVLCVQETKCVDHVFPWIGFKGLGYELSYTGESTYNGVAILSKSHQSSLNLNPILEPDLGARSIAATIQGIRILNVYVPYGEAVGTEKFKNKLDWLDGLKGLLSDMKDKPMIVSGDFNIAPDDRDVYDPFVRREKLICSTPERAKLRALLDSGFVDALREHTPDPALFTWWSYRSGAVEHNRGLRIDHHLVNTSLKQAIQAVDIDFAARKNPNSSDHAPVTLTLQV